MKYGVKVWKLPRGSPYCGKLLFRELLGIFRIVEKKMKLLI